MHQALDAVDSEGVQPMHVACSGGHMHIVKRLHVHGALLEAEDHESADRQSSIQSINQSTNQSTGGGGS